MKKITIPIGECDIEMFEKLIYSGYDNFTWTFETDGGEAIDVEFIKDEGENE